MNQDLSTTISGLFLPKVTKLLNDNESDQKISNIFIAVSRIQIYLMLLIFSGFYIFGDKFLVMWVGKEYLDAYYIILILL
jgi:O-antigen/teichoic acid export membrane protein